MGWISFALDLVAGPKKWLVAGIAAALLAVAVAGYVGWQKLTIAGLERDLARISSELEARTGERDRANEIARRNAQAVAQLRADQERQLAALKTQSETRVRDLKRAGKVMEAIRAEPTGDDPIPCVLRPLLGDPDVVDPDCVPASLRAGAGSADRAPAHP